MSGYSKAEKLFHKLYLSNYFISRASMEMDQIMYGIQAEKIEITEYVFITGLARSGTTALMRKIFQTGDYASLQYSNMPLLLCPNLWNKEVSIEKHERAHKDGILVDGNSPEEFDEYFWKVFLKDSYITEGLLPHEVPPEIMEKYLQYISLVCLSKKKTRYISKNNNNILRLSSLQKLPGSKIIVLYREPLSHAASLRKLHLSFTETQKEEPFVLEYFNYLGHHEFGLGHKPFVLAADAQKIPYQGNTIEYWTLIWINYYTYLLDHYNPSYLLLSFEDLIKDQGYVNEQLENFLHCECGIYKDDSHSPDKYRDICCDVEIQQKAKEIYKKLQNKKLNRDRTAK